MKILFFGIKEVVLKHLIKFDKYETIISKAELSEIPCCGNFNYIEYDGNSKPIFKITANYTDNNKMFKIYDSNNNEVDLGDRTLFNNGFTNIQILILIRVLFIKNTTIIIIN